MNKTKFVSDLKAKDNVQDIFMIKYLSVMEARDGRSYLNVVLADNSGDLEARKWVGAEKVAAQMERGDFAAVKGKVNSYQGRLQLIIDHIEKVDGEALNRGDFVPKAANEAQAMLDELIALVDGLDDVYIKDLLNSVLFDHEIQRRLQTWYAGRTIHHAYEAGLLEHILSCSKLAVILSSHYNVNKNYVVAGAIMHDLCKVFELSEGPLVDYTEEGKLVGHLVKGVELLDFHCGKIKGFPYQTKLHLKHILLSHHGHYEYGSPKVPQTSEAYLVHLIDLMDSKMNSLDMIKKTDNTPGRWSGFVRHLDRIVYKEELPFFPKYVDEIKEIKGEDRSKSNSKGFKKRNNDEPLKHSMADKLKGLKLK